MLLSIASMVWLSACMGSQPNQSVDHNSDREICYGLASIPSYNIYHEVRLAAVKSRNINCQDYEDQIANQLQLDRIEEKLADMKKQAAEDKSDAEFDRSIERMQDGMRELIYK